MEVINSKDFFSVLKLKGIRSNDNEHPNLRQFLCINEKNPDILLVKNVKKTLEQMSENEEFMAAIE